MKHNFLVFCGMAAACALLLQGCGSAVAYVYETHQAKNYSGPSSDADVASYVLSDPTTPSDFVKNVRATGESLGFQVQPLSLAPPTVYLSKRDPRAFTSLTVGLGPDGKTVSLNATSVGTGKSGAAAPLLAQFEDKLSGQSKLVTRSD